jgi:peptide/nickel transport system permease protein
MTRLFAPIVRRLLQMAVMLGLSSFVLFGLLSVLPGEPVDLLAMSSPEAAEEDVASLRRLRGLDRPWPERYWRWLVGSYAPLQPPIVPAERLTPIAVELPPEGEAEVPLDAPDDTPAPALRFSRPGLYAAPVVVRSAEGLEAVGLRPIGVAPPTAEVPTPPTGRAPEGFAVLGGAERQLAGSTEDAVGVGRTSPASLMDAARAVGPPLPLLSFWGSSQVFFASAPDRRDAPALRRVRVPIAALCPRCPAETSFRVDEGPGSFDATSYGGAFEGPGRTAVLFTATAPDGRELRSGFVVDHGAIDDPQSFRRGVLFAVLGDTAALGWSTAFKRPVWELLAGPGATGDDDDLAGAILRAGPVANTLALGLPALLLALGAAIPLALLGALHRGAWIDRVVGALSLATMSAPAFWLATLAVAVFAGRLRWLPAGDAQSAGVPVDLAAVVVDRLWHAALPTAVLAAVYLGPFVRHLRAALLEVLPLDFVRAARARGLSETALLARHVLPHASFPLIQAVALAMPQLFSGALLIELVFSWPGLGRLQYDAIVHNDAHLGVIVLLASAALVMLANLAADVACAFIDPRSRSLETPAGRGAA